MKFSRSLLTAALTVPLLVGVPAVAAPNAPATVPDKASTTNPAAVKVLDNSIAAYKRLSKFSQTFSIVDKRGDKSTTLTGTFVFNRPDKARVEIESEGKKSLTVSDGTNIISQVGPESFRKQEVDKNGLLSPIAAVASRIPGAATGPLTDLLDGTNWLKSDANSFASATLTKTKRENVLVLVTKASAGETPVTFRFAFNRKTHLLTQAQAEIERDGVSYSNSTTFGEPAATAPAAFDFTLPAGGRFVEATAEPMNYDARLVVGAEPLALSGKTLEGKDFSLENYKGKVVLLDFWATWCSPCINELPRVQSSYARYHPQGFDIVGISLDEDEAALRRLVKERELPWTQIFDGQGWESANAQTYGIQAIPFTLLIGKDGKIAAVNPRGSTLDLAIEKALAS